ncbi:hypothetical protein CLIB1423_17S03026 [[Candida] railenensis]|uniref:Glycoside hydrolase family 3 N-terminal domain-containing protein n=1 Tax=[Candida] railenensis TaxID=45579 RepID=A0A9P0QUM4_9ASCO|nr:hypothetical protein CLIB1423_17S03026 [[Candida] railenensis]
MQVGQLLCGGFQGTSVTPQAYHLIVKHHVSSMILSKKNITSVQQITKLIRDLQYIAMTQGGYKYPLMFAVDEEGGMMNSLFDPDFLTQFPGAMALAATGDTELVYNVSKALASELKLIGFSILLGPVLDVVTKLSHQLVGVRSFGTTPEEVTKFGRAAAKGLQDGGLFTVGKHFPGIGNASVDSLLELPMMADSLEQIKSFNSQPFAKLIEEGILDGISVAGCAVPTISPDEIHSCLSPIIVNQLLRQELKFDGMVISECLEMDALFHSIGLGQGVVLALYAGCDLVMVCHNLTLQNEAIESMEKALQNGNLDEEIVSGSLRRINKLQKRLPTWQEMFPEGEKSARDGLVLFKEKFPEAWENHQRLSELAYKKSVTLVRDYNGALPITKWISPNSGTAAAAAAAAAASASSSSAQSQSTSSENNNILILTPLLNPLYKSVKDDNSEEPQLYVGEDVFKKFGELLANHPFNSKSQTPYNVLHTTYTANGLTSLHESLIENSQVVIVLTSEASRNMYQIGIVKYISILCGANPYSFSSNGTNTKLSKPLVIVATSSPYDFFYNKSIGSTYLCCYDYTDNVLEQLVGVLMGDIQAEGCIPGEKKYISGARSKKRKQLDAKGMGGLGLNSSNSAKRIVKRNPTPKRRWLVDELDLQRDWNALFKLWKNNSNGEEEDSDHLHFDRRAEEINYQSDSFYKMLYLLLRTNNKTQKHFVVKNASLNILYGVVLTWVNEHQSMSLSGEQVAGESDKVGSIMYLIVDKSKRFQSIGKNLHARAMRYLVEEQKCKVITLGCSFPLISLVNLKTITENSKVVSFFNNVGWDLIGNEGEQIKKHIMILDNLSNWSVPKKIIRELMIVGVRFDICSDPEKLMNLINKSSVKKISEGDKDTNVTGEGTENDTKDGKNDEAADTDKDLNQFSDEEMQAKDKVKALYMEAIKYLDNNSSNGVKIIIALEPTNQNVIGSVILFNNRSLLSKFFPFMNQAAAESTVGEPLIGGIIGPIIDPSYSNLTEIFKFGLVCSGITFLKSSNTDSTNKMDQCIIIGIDEQNSSNVNGIKDIGFKEWKHYYDYYEKKRADQFA